MKSNCYHRRSSKDIKICGGMTHCVSYEDAVSAARRGLTVQATNTKSLYFADKDGNEVRVYLSVHPEHTPDGKIMQDEIDRERAEREAGWLHDR